MRRRDVALAIAIVGLGAIAIREYVARDDVRPPPAIALPAEGPLVLIAAGDVLVTDPIEESTANEVRGLFAKAHLSVANLDMTLLDDGAASRVRGAGTWPMGTPRDARTLRDLGLHVVSLANNHGSDAGTDAAGTARQILREAGIEAAGSGGDLSEARAPVFIGSSTRRVAFIAVTTSAMPESRATDATAAVEARPGVNALRYAMTITVDPATFQTLSQSLRALEAGPPAGPDTLTFFGTPIRKGEDTSVEFAVDERDQEAMLAVIAAARASAEVVVVSVHSHEPSNAAEEPAVFVRHFARAAIDRGASLVFGHGPHRLRGVELYRQGAILYSLGNFVYPAKSVLGVKADMYDLGADLYETALSGGPSGPGSLNLENPVWWNGVLASGVFENGELRTLRLIPLDLGLNLPIEARGLPAVASGDGAVEVLRTVDRLSRPFGTMVDVETGQVRALPDVRLITPSSPAR